MSVFDVSSNSNASHLTVAFTLVAPFLTRNSPLYVERPFARLTDFDVIFDVEEQNYGNIVGGFGYSQFGFSFNFNVQQQNFLGSGNTVGIGTTATNKVSIEIRS